MRESGRAEQSLLGTQRCDFHIGYNLLLAWSRRCTFTLLGNDSRTIQDVVDRLQKRGIIIDSANENKQCGDRTKKANAHSSTTIVSGSITLAFPFPLSFVTTFEDFLGLAGVTRWIRVGSATRDGPAMGATETSGSGISRLGTNQKVEIEAHCGHILVERAGWNRLRHGLRKGTR